MNERGTAEEQRGLTDEQLVGMLREMITARVFSTRAFNLQRQGRLGTMAPIDGNEAVVVATTFALKPQHDWIFPQYREQYGLGRYGAEVMRRHALYLAGHPAGSYFEPGLNVFPAQISLAAQVPHAVGMAWGLMLQGHPGVAAVFFGDGASSEGDFYEAANFAAVIKAPVLFLLVNNGWAISTPTSRQTAAVTFADKAAAFGMPGVRVDGRDPVAVWEVVRAARARAAAGEGPTLIEAVTQRLGHHTTADDPTRYIPADQLAAGRAADPVITFAAQLRQLHLWDDERQAATEAEALAAVDAAVDAALATELAPDTFFEHVFADSNQRLDRQRAALLDAHQRGEW